MRIGKIFSEENLISLPEDYNSTIADGLLSKKRLNRKINDFNGYVGYIGNDRTIYYSADFEKNTLNIYR